MVLAAGQKVRTKPGAFAGEHADWNNQPAVVVSAYGKLNGEIAYVISLRNGTKVVVPTSWLAEV